jgi:hypothetical protein
LPTTLPDSYTRLLQINVGLELLDVKQVSSRLMIILFFAIQVTKNFANSWRSTAFFLSSRILPVGEPFSKQSLASKSKFSAACKQRLAFPTPLKPFF